MTVMEAVRAGLSTTKTGTQRSFKVSGDRYVGDKFQDYAMSHAMKYGTGNAVMRDYVYFCVLNGKRESLPHCQLRWQRKLGRIGGD